MDKVTKDVLNVQEVAELLQVSPLTIKEWARAEKIPGAKVGRTWRFSKRQILEWIEKGGNK